MRFGVQLLIFEFSMFGIYLGILNFEAFWL